MHIKEVASRVLGVDFDFDIQEISCDGVSVTYKNNAAIVGGCSVPALARAYMLLAKGISEGKAAFEINENAHFKDCGVMLDVSRGRVMTVSGVKKYLEYMALYGMNMLMLYTEDVYEVEEYPFMGYQRGRYTLKELQEIDEYAACLGIEVIPCIQTLGHLEKFLRYGAHKCMAENANVLLPGLDKTYAFIEACIATVRKAFRSNRIHIGCDEARGLGFGKSYALHGYRSPMEIFNEHLAQVVEICKKYNYRPMMWSDMYFSFAAPNKSEDYGLEIQVPQDAIDAMPDIDMVFWDYYHANNECYAVNIDKHKQFNRNIIFAGGIWTWNGFVPYFRWTYETVRPAMEECLRRGIDSVLACSWVSGGAETSHFMAIPCFAMYSEYCWRGLECTKEDIYSVAEFVSKMPYELTEAISDLNCREEGDYNVGLLTLWSDPLINLLCYGFDFEKAEQLYEAALRTFEKYPDAPDIEYYKAVLRSALDKVKIHLTLHRHYKAGDRAWLADFAANAIPKMQKNFEELYRLHHDLWKQDYKAQGYELLSIRFAGAIERIRYTGEVINDYLTGKIDCIEELEPEVLQGKKQKLVYSAYF